jgi:hypothetical protein
LHRVPVAGRCFLFPSSTRRWQHLSAARRARDDGSCQELIANVESESASANSTTRPNQYWVITMRIFLAISVTVRVAFFSLLAGLVIGLVLASQLAPVPGS